MEEKGLWNRFTDRLVEQGFVEKTDGSPTQGSATAGAPSAPTLPSFTSSPSSGSASIAIGAEDLQTLEALKQRVYGKPSSYTVFAQVRSKLGGRVDLNTIFEVLQATNPGITREGVVQDIDNHLGIVKAIAREFDAKIQQSRADNVDGSAAEIERLRAANETAQREIAERATQITRLEQKRKEAELAVANGEAHFKAIQEQLTLPLTQARELLQPRA
jgi:hypothetical protein